ncbi:MAG TPA: Gfo/Idh/MocA family oxidoreductase [Opitutaceae bacterium]|jgi:predicted dehydrogenase|nr:Gfo/Idh/MocA family oxidoreductase [Opitutaceae bacterium]
MAKLRGAIIGCGNISEFHLRGWARIPEVEICAVVDPDLSRAKLRRTQFAPHAQVYSGMQEALARQPLDFVDITTPPWMHKEQCLLAAKTGLHIICQKPLCDDLAEATSLVKALESYPKRFCVHENHRYRPWFREALRLCHAGVLGTPRYLEITQHDPCEPPEEINTTATHGVFLQYGVHLVDMAEALFGRPSSVEANMLHLNPRVRGESLANVLLRYERAQASLTVSWKAAGIQQSHALLVGDKGEAWYEGSLTRAGKARFRVYQDKSLILDENRSPMSDYMESFFQFEQEFVASVAGSGLPPQTAASNLDSLKTTFAAYAAAKGTP